jgi:hypothetical protein
MDKARDYMNMYVAPHRLVSVSAFEEDHPNETGVFNVAVLQRGSGSTPNAPAEPIVGGIYSWSVVESSARWDAVLRQAAFKAEQRDGALVAGFNWSTGGKQDLRAAAVVAWAKTHEDMLVDADRGGCSCALF